MKTNDIIKLYKNKLNKSKKILDQGFLLCLGDKIKLTDKDKELFIDDINFYNNILKIL